jgi:hypothetical protein
MTKNNATNLALKNAKSTTNGVNLIAIADPLTVINAVTGCVKLYVTRREMRENVGADGKDVMEIGNLFKNAENFTKKNIKSLVINKHKDIIKQ